MALLNQLVASPLSSYFMDWTSMRSWIHPIPSVISFPQDVTYIYNQKLILSIGNTFWLLIAWDFWFTLPHSLENWKLLHVGVGRTSCKICRWPLPSCKVVSAADCWLITFETEGEATCLWINGHPVGNSMMRHHQHTSQHRSRTACWPIHEAGSVRHFAATGPNHELPVGRNIRKNEHIILHVSFSTGKITRRPGEPTILHLSNEIT